jgi:hypothetical protein
MNELANPQLSAWESFYVIVGSSAAALIGLQFVVMTLIADRRRLAASLDTLDAFGTPTVVHFGGALVVSAIASAPWASLSTMSIVLGVFGLSGLVYGGVVVRRARRQTGYEPVWQDWIWYATLPVCAYGGLALSAVFLRTDARLGLFVVAASALGLLLIGIHNAWDAVTHIIATDTNSADA